MPHSRQRCSSKFSFFLAISWSPSFSTTRFVKLVAHHAQGLQEARLPTPHRQLRGARHLLEPDRLDQDLLVQPADELAHHRVPEQVLEIPLLLAPDPDSIAHCRLLARPDNRPPCVIARGDRA